MTTGLSTHLERASTMLGGIIEGISCDYVMTDGEILGLRSWLVMHDSLRMHHPFAEAAAHIERALEDQVIGADEREEILEWCHALNEANSLARRCLTTATRHLHGFLHGIAVDRRITVAELRDLHDWLLDHEHLGDSWPFNLVWSEIARVLADGKIDAREHKELLAFCAEFAERPVAGPTIHDSVPDPWMRSDAPILKPIDRICVATPSIAFKSRTFCFTGNARYGSRKQLESLVRERDGLVHSNVTRKLDYLVIGAQSHPCWAYASYGRKVETALGNQQTGCKTAIVREDDFLVACRVE